MDLSETFNSVNIFLSTLQIMGFIGVLVKNLFVHICQIENSKVHRI